LIDNISSKIVPLEKKVIYGANDLTLPAGVLFRPISFIIVHV